MKHSHGWGYPANARIAHYFVDEHAVCSPGVGYLSDLYIAEKPIGATQEPCEKCLGYIEHWVRLMRSAETITLKVDHP